MLHPSPRKVHIPVSHVSYGSRVYNLLNPPKFQEPLNKWKPFWDPNSYLTDMKNHGNDTTTLEKLFSENIVEEDIKPIEKKRQLDIPEYSDIIPVTTKIKKNGLVSVIIHNEMANMCENFYSKGKKPSIEVRIKSLHDFGYPDDILLNTIKKDCKRVKDSVLLDEFILGIFGESDGKKVATVKKKTIHQILKIKKKIYAMPEQDEEQNPNSDYEDEN